MTSRTFVNYYELLQISRAATPDDVRDAIRKQRRVWVKRQASADPAKRADADLKVRQLDEAERTLLNPDQRRRYDQELANYRRPDPTPKDHAADDDPVQRAMAYLDQGNASAAHTAARQAIDRHSSNDLAWWVLGHASFLMGRMGDAEYEFAEAIRLRPGEPGYHAELGDVYTQQEKWPDAMREYETALRLEPGNPEYRTAIAQVHGATGRASTALEIMERVVAEHPDDEYFRYYLALALHDSAIQATSLFPDGYLPTSERQVALAEQHAARIETLGLADQEVREWAANLRDMASDARAPMWVRSDYLRYYVIAVLLLLIVPGLTGDAALTFLGIICAAGVIWLYVYRHRKPTWVHRRKFVAHEMIEPGI